MSVGRKSISQQIGAVEASADFAKDSLWEILYGHLKMENV